MTSNEHVPETSSKKTVSEHIEEAVELKYCHRSGTHTCRLGSIHVNEREEEIIKQHLTTLANQIHEASAVECERRRISGMGGEYEDFENGYELGYNKALQTTADWHRAQIIK